MGKPFHLNKGLVFLLFFVAGSLLYYSSMNSSFHYDDSIHIVENSDIKIKDLSYDSLKNAAFTNDDGLRPLSYLSFALNHYFNGSDTTSYHLVNVLIHIINAFLIYLIMLRLFESSDADDERRRMVTVTAFFTAFIWLVTPVNSQAVIYIVQRMTTMMTLFFLLSFLMYLIGRESNRLIFFIISLVSLILSILSKESAIVLIPVIIVYELIFIKKCSVKNVTKAEKAGLTLLLLLSIIPIVIYSDAIVREFSEFNDAFGFTIYERTLTQFRVLVFYLSLILFPIPGRLSITHDILHSTSLFSPMTTILSILLISAIFVAAIIRVKRSPYFSFAIFWFFITLSVSIIMPVEVRAYEHRIYLPCIFIIGIFVEFTVSLIYKRSRAALIVTLVAIAVLCSAATYVRSRVWENELTLWKNVSDKSPNDSEAQYAVGRAYISMKMFNEAEPYTKRALEMILENPQKQQKYFLEEAYSNLGIVQLRTRKFNLAEKNLLKAIESNKNYQGAYYYLGILYYQTRNYKAAESNFSEAIRLDPSYKESYIGMGKVYASLRIYNDALMYFKKAIELDPRNVPAHNEVGVIYMNQGKFDDAMIYFKKALYYDPNDEIVLRNIRHLSSKKKQTSSP